MTKTKRILGLLVLLPAAAAQADEGGISFWLPGQFGALAAAPTEPGWSLPLIYYHVSADESANKPFPRGGRSTLGLDAKADLLFASPTYTFAEPLLGAQAAVSMVAAVGRSEVSVDATITGPRGRSFSGGVDDSLNGGSDLYLLGTLKWNHGVHNFMAYSMGNIPVGAYDPDRLVNIGLGHASLDAGGGYTYFDKENEFSAVAGMTYNWENTDVDYQNGIDAHLDWSASHFITGQTHMGLVGYFYHQLTGDSGSGATLGDFKSRVSGVGPQAGHFFKVGEQLWYSNLKGYYEFDAKNRAEGWNLWLTLVIPLSGKQ
ncbi:transporter [Pseudomonas sp. LS1212]|uniref:SphA family protein n=1 Tax=Pseudomonas sp. LS1212 TaxID=2972478 RepID=UPI00215D38DD|nr:transporter [Pseudomonas sp. LS1212]UVJ46290.1 transporter [Pseudomonas sp. LS1212]